MRIAFWILKSTNAYSEYVIINAIPVQQWLHERTSVLRYTCIDCLVKQLQCVTFPYEINLTFNPVYSIPFCTYTHSCSRIERINLLKPTGHVTHHRFNIQQLYTLPTQCLGVLYLSENKQRLVPLTA